MQGPQNHVPTQDELAAEERRQRKLQRRWTSPNSWDTSGLSYGRAYPEYDIIQTGELVLQIEGWNDGVRRTWADGKSQRVENLVDQIVTGIETLIAARRSNREETERKDREWQEISRRRRLKEQRAQREKDRDAYVQSILARHQEAKHLRAWLLLVGSQVHALPNSDFSRLAAWAKEKLNNLDSLLAPENIDGHLQSIGLFPGVDPLHDPLGEPPEHPQWRWQL